MMIASMGGNQTFIHIAPFKTTIHKTKSKKTQDSQKQNESKWFNRECEMSGNFRMQCPNVCADLTPGGMEPPGVELMGNQCVMRTFRKS